MSRPLPISSVQQVSARSIMANTKSAKKAARQITRRTAINKSRRSRLRGVVRKVEEAITAGDRPAALAAMAQAEPAIIRAAPQSLAARAPDRQAGEIAFALCKSALGRRRMLARPATLQWIVVKLLQY